MASALLKSQFRFATLTTRISNKTRVNFYNPFLSFLPIPTRYRPSQLKTRSSSMSENDVAVKTTTTTTSKDDVIVQYVVLRRDLIDTWPMGSVVTQGCHASVGAIWLHRDDPDTVKYCSPENIDSMHKVTLELKGQTQLTNLSEKLTAAGIAHKLWIEQPENFPTCLATKPYPKSQVSAFFKKLKLCK